MNSKECLEKIYDGYQYGMAGRSYYDIIKQSLDRLEKLEKENQELLVNKNVAQGIATKLKEENNKLKKVIKILKEAVDEIEIITCDEEDCYGELCLYQKINGSISIPLKTKEDYILVKEVKENEN